MEGPGGGRHARSAASIWLSPRWRASPPCRSPAGAEQAAGGAGTGSPLTAAIAEMVREDKKAGRAELDPARGKLDKTAA